MLSSPNSGMHSLPFIITVLSWKGFIQGLNVSKPEVEWCSRILYLPQKWLSDSWYEKDMMGKKPNKQPKLNLSRFYSYHAHQATQRSKTLRVIPSDLKFVWIHESITAISTNTLLIVLTVAILWTTLVLPSLITNLHLLRWAKTSQMNEKKHNVWGLYGFGFLFVSISPQSHLWFFGDFSHPPGVVPEVLGGSAGNFSTSGLARWAIAVLVIAPSYCTWFQNEQCFHKVHISSAWRQFGTVRLIRRACPPQGV